MKVSLRWLLGFMLSEYEQLPDDLNFQSGVETDRLLIYSLESEVEERQEAMGITTQEL